MEAGEYFLLIEKVNLNFLEISKKKLDFVLSVEGPSTCSIKHAEGGKNSMIHDFLLYESWKSYTESRESRKINSI